MHPAVCHKVFVSLHHMHTKGTAIEGQYTPRVKMLYTSCFKREQNTSLLWKKKSYWMIAHSTTTL